MTRRATLLLMLSLILSGSDPRADSAASYTSAALQAQPGALPPGQKRPDAPQLAPYVPTPQDVVDRMLKLGGVTKSDVVLDLGCGDGRIPITAAKTYGAKGIGVDIDPQRIAEANANAKAAGVTNLVTFKLEDAMTTDLSQATVVTLYLLSSSNLKLRPILTRQLKPGTRIVAHNFAMGDWEAEKIDTFQDKEGRTRTLYRWTADGRVRQ
ncbi:MAG TPA: methyltransferase domain-containing protein [Vicinamibacterales bacterium]|nr:methyltransferase domain-containing protein [Vicinamibacterales bacterium]